ncbi:MAG: response regulator [Pirellulaceae bacterium]
MIGHKRIFQIAVWLFCVVCVNQWLLLPVWSAEQNLSPEQRLQAAENAIDRLRTSTDDVALANAWTDKALAELELAKLDDAKSSVDRAVAVALASQNHVAIFHACLADGQLQLAQGNQQQAAERLYVALADPVLNDHADVLNSVRRGPALLQFAELAIKRNHPPLAIEFAKQAHHLGVRIGDAELSARSAFVVAKLAYWGCEFEAAWSWCQKAADLQLANSHEIDIDTRLLRMSLDFQRSPEKAWEAWEELRLWKSQLDDDMTATQQAWFDHLNASAELLAGNVANAQAWAEKAVSISSSDPIQHVAAQLVLAETFLAGNELANAKALLEQLMPETLPTLQRWKRFQLLSRAIGGDPQRAAWESEFAHPESLVKQHAWEFLSTLQRSVVSEQQQRLDDVNESIVDAKKSAATAQNSLYRFQKFGTFGAGILTLLGTAVLLRHNRVRRQSHVQLEHQQQLLQQAQAMLDQEKKVHLESTEQIADLKNDLDQLLEMAARQRLFELLGANQKRNEVSHLIQQLPAESMPIMEFADIIRPYLAELAPGQRVELERDENATAAVHFPLGMATVLIEWVSGFLHSLPRDAEVKLSVQQVFLNSTWKSDWPELPATEYFAWRLMAYGDGALALEDGANAGRGFSQVSLIRYFLRSQGGAMRRKTEFDRQRVTDMMVPVGTSDKRLAPLVDHIVGSRRILIVDDNALVTDLLVRRLESLGLASDKCSSVEQAMRRLESEAFGAVLCEIDFGDSLGGQALKRWCEGKRPGLSVILMSHDELQAQELGEDVLLKPIEVETLQRIFADWMSATLRSD